MSSTDDTRQYYLPDSDVDEPVELNLSPERSRFTELVVRSEFDTDDTLITSGNLSEVPDSTTPICPRAAIYWLAMNILFKMLGCAIFYLYWRCTDDSDYFVSSSVVTAIYYTYGAYACLVLYSNIKNDRLPFTWSQRCVGFIVYTGCPLYFTYVFYVRLFLRGDFFLALFHDYNSAVSGYDGDHRFVLLTSEKPCNSVPYLFFVSLFAYVASMLYDFVNMIFPRMWTRVLLRSGVCF